MSSYEVEHIGPHTLYRGDCMEMLGQLQADAVVSDPPYGMNWHFTGQGSGRNARGSKNSRFKGKRIVGDTDTFDPTPWLAFPNVILWGFHHFPQHLERGSVLIWLKKYDAQFQTFLSDADVAWMRGGHGVYCSRTINPNSLQSEKCHPTQKPVALMAWCLTFLPQAKTILDPYAGSFTTGLACIQLGRTFIGVEIEREFFDIGCQRMHAAMAQPDLFIAQPPIATQYRLFEGTS